MRYLGISVILLLAACGNSGPAPRNADSGSPEAGTSIPTGTPDSLGIIGTVVADTLPVSQTGVDAIQAVDGGMPDTLIFLSETGIDSVSNPDSVTSADVMPVKQTDVLPAMDTVRIPETGADSEKQADTLSPADTVTSSDTVTFGPETGIQAGPEVQVNPCAPNPCQNGGTCSVSGSSAVCTCAGNRDPATNCSACLAGFSGADCTPVDKCAGVVCKDDGAFCNGIEYCDPASGRCLHKDAPDCGAHGTCNPFITACECSPNFAGPACNQCAPGTIGTYPNCTADACHPNPCQNNGSCSVSGNSAVCTCTGNWNPATSCSACLGNWDVATGCTTCISGFTGADCGTPLPCGGTNCSGHGICSSAGNICGCDLGYTGDSCNTCSPGYAGYPNCILTPRPKISGLAIDCSSTPGGCLSAGDTYPVTFSATNATSCTANAVRVSGLGSSGSVSSCVISGSSGSFTYSTGSTAFDVIQITVSVSGPGGQTSSSINVTLE